MRKLSLLLLLATAAAPAMAQEHDRGGRQHRNDSSEQAESQPRRSSETRSSEARSSVQRTERSGGDQAGAFERVSEFRQQRIEAAQTQPAQPAGEDNVRVRRSGRDGDNVRTGDGGTTAGSSTTNWRERERHVRTIPDTQPTARQPSTSEREAFQGRNRRDYRDGNYTRWSDNWRHDRRYDWSRYRNHHQSIFRLGAYYDPFGWSYRRWSTGSFLYPSYYGSSFWLNDPWQYRLPPAYGPYRWVRYWDDALLVNIYTGEVVDVMHGFFW
jgi:hypothetical protein